MITSILVEYGDDKQADRAQSGAISVAGWTGASLRVVGAVPPEAASPRSLDTAVREVRRDAGTIQEQADRAGVPIVPSLEVDDTEEALVEAAGKGDVFVVPGLPPAEEGGPARDKAVALLRDGACGVLAGLPEEPAFKRLYVSCREGTEGLWGLRFARAIAAAYDCTVTLGSIQGDKAHAAALTEAAAAYFEAQPGREVVEDPRDGAGTSTAEILNAAQEAGADLLIRGEAPYGFVDRVLAGVHPEALIENADIPVLIAR